VLTADMQEKGRNMRRDQEKWMDDLWVAVMKEEGENRRKGSKARLKQRNRRRVHGVYNQKSS
jgi:hypothetical protein